MMHARQAGLTLVELMVVVAVMAIIATIAYPMYTAQVQKSRRADAKVALQTIAMAQERYYTVYGEYAAISVSTLQVPTHIHSGNSDQGYYGLSVNLPGTGNQQFTASAVAASGGAQASDDDCATFTIDQLGVKTDFDSGGAQNDNCW